MTQMIYACTCPECEGQKEQFNNVTKPKHYQGKYGLEAIEVIKNFLTEEELRGYYKGNALKYLLRERSKNGLEDLKKLDRYLDWLIKETEEANERR
ncbi:TPA: DUF3310 domain-containing protein [Streptococcus suis]